MHGPGKLAAVDVVIPVELTINVTLNSGLTKEYQTGRGVILKFESVDPLKVTMITIGGNPTKVWNLLNQNFQRLPQPIGLSEYKYYGDMARFILGNWPQTPV